jgi:hypothetical protein
LSSARRNEDDGNQIVEAVVSAMGWPGDAQRLYLLEEEATALWQEPTVILQ